MLLHAIFKRGLETARVTDNATLQGIGGLRKKEKKTGGLFLVPSHALCFVHAASQKKATVQNVQVLHAHLQLHHKKWQVQGMPPGKIQQEQKKTPQPQTCQSCSARAQTRERQTSPGRAGPSPGNSPVVVHHVPHVITERDDLSQAGAPGRPLGPCGSPQAHGATGHSAALSHGVRAAQCHREGLSGGVCRQLPSFKLPPV